MAERNVKVIDPVGLHARPATVLVMTASKFKNNDIHIVINEQKILDAKSILNVMSSAIKCNEEFTLRVTGENDQEIIEQLIHTLAQQKILEIV